MKSLPLRLFLLLVILSFAVVAKAQFTIDCPPNINVPCMVPAAPNNYVAWLAAGGDVTLQGAAVDTSSYTVDSEVTSPCLITRTYTIEDKNGNDATCEQTITVLADNVDPTARCRNITVRLGQTGMVDITPSLLDNGSTDNCGIASITDNISFVGCNDIGSSITYTMTVTDNCGNSRTCTGTISVNTCPPDQLIDLNANCTITIPDYSSLFDVFDGCNRNYTSVTQNPVAGTILPSAHNQVHTIQFMVTNGVLSDNCSIHITAKDRTRPVINCPAAVFNAVLPNNQNLTPANLGITAVDNCGGAVTLSVARQGLQTCNGNVDDFGVSAEVCCGDVNRTVSYTVMATDANGNTATCNRMVTVADRAVPTIVAGSLPDITISCQYPLNVSNLSAFGTFVAQGQPRNNIVINDPGDPRYQPTGIAGRDGVYSDCLAATVTVTPRNMLTNCQTGQIKRDFVITDASGNRSTYTQTITVVNTRRFLATDITWPTKNVTFNSCNNVTPLPAVTGSPVLANVNCSLVAATYSDQKFTQNVCGFIKRTWTVIDWCQYQSNNPNSPGKFTFVQNISYANTVAPTFGPKVCRDTIVNTNAGCAATISLTATAQDDCMPTNNVVWSPQLDLGGDGTVDFTGTTATVTRTLSLGRHTLNWVVKDRCNNLRQCRINITVRDQVAPSATVRNIATNINAVSLNSIVWASDLILYGSDNCTAANQLTYSFSATTVQTSRTFTCSHRGNNNVDVWVRDAAGNQTKVTAIVNVQDNHGVCTNANTQTQQRQYPTIDAHVIGDLSPNPFDQQTSLQINLQNSEEVNYYIWNVDGTIIYNKTLNLESGEHTITIENENKVMNSGMYFCKVKAGKTERVFKLIKI
jgi:hypothetical protein